MLFNDKLCDSGTPFLSFFNDFVTTLQTGGTFFALVFHTKKKSGAGVFFKKEK